MKPTIRKNIALYATIAAALIAAPISMQAQSQHAKKSEATQAGSSTAKKHRHLPFHGKAAKVDLAAKTLKVGHMVIHITSETKITKAGKPAKLSDISVGERVSGAYLKSDDGTMNATVVHVGGKGKAKGKKTPQ